MTVNGEAVSPGSGSTGNTLSAAGDVTAKPRATVASLDRNVERLLKADVGTADWMTARKQAQDLLTVLVEETRAGFDALKPDGVTPEEKPSWNALEDFDSRAKEVAPLLVAAVQLEDAATVVRSYAAGDATKLSQALEHLGTVKANAPKLLDRHRQALEGQFVLAELAFPLAADSPVEARFLRGGMMPPAVETPASSSSRVAGGAPGATAPAAAHLGALHRWASAALLITSPHRNVELRCSRSLSSFAARDVRALRSEPRSFRR